MKKKLAVGILSAVLLVGGATAAFGATDTAKLDEIKSLTQQMFSIQKQIIDKEVEAGLRAADQADIIKKGIDKRQEASDKALAEGKVPGSGFCNGDFKAGNKVKKFSSKEPLTAEQIQAWSEAAQARIDKQVEAMKQNGKLTEEQIQTWHDAALAQLKVQEEALKNGTFVPGGMGMGKHGADGNRSWGNQKAPAQSSTSASSANVQ